MIYSPKEIGLDVGYITSNLQAMCLCPFHDSWGIKNATFNMKTGLFYCFACGAVSTAIELSKKLGGDVTFVSSSTITTKKSNNEWRVLLNNPVAINNTYLKKRGVLNETIERLGVRENERGVIFPLKNKNGDIVGVQTRQYSGKIRYLTFGQKVMFGLNYLNSYDIKAPVVLCEGVFGFINLIQKGFQAIAFLGSGINKDVQLLDSYNVIGIFDNDLAGLSASKKLLKFLPLSKVVIPGYEVDEAAVIDLSKQTRDVRKINETLKILA